MHLYLACSGDQPLAEGQAESVQAVPVQSSKIWLRNKLQFWLLDFLKPRKTSTHTIFNSMLICTDADCLLTAFPSDSILLIRTATLFSRFKI